MCAAGVPRAYRLADLIAVLNGLHGWNVSGLSASRLLAWVRLGAVGATDILGTRTSELSPSAAGCTDSKGRGETNDSYDDGYMGFQAPYLREFFTTPGQRDAARRLHRDLVVSLGGARGITFFTRAASVTALC